jgi:hypothetical protein
MPFHAIARALRGKPTIEELPVPNSRDDIIDDDDTGETADEDERTAADILADCIHEISTIEDVDDREGTARAIAAYFGVSLTVGG